MAGFLVPVAVAVAVYVFGRTHTPDYTRGLFGQHGVGVIDLKARLGSALMALAVVQLLLGLWMYRRLPGAGAAPRRVQPTHRLIGLLAFLLSLPIAYQCVIAYGVEFSSSRVAVHSIAGCLLYGVFVAKVLVVRSRRLPGWALPAAGGALVVVIALLWYTAALWFFAGSAPGF
ncbi:DUF6529 family protein [Streptomyces sp. Tue6028]|uniref:DUF6529 family protein n=1 Tax=Streptomyces sp. Tue6028 TaxID=2036037 RepID=UPI003D7571E3